MSTNYYLRTYSGEIVDKYFPDEYEVTRGELVVMPDGRKFYPCVFEIHIGKCSWGWLPTFEQHRNAYQSVEEMIEFIHNHAEITIINECYEVLTLDDLKRELIDWNKDNLDAKDHCEYEKKEGYSVKSFKDKDGYIFIQGAYS